MTFSVEMKNIAIFERNNQISVHVIRWHNGKYEIHRKAKIKNKRHFNLLMFMVDGKKHFLPYFQHESSS